MAMLFSPSVHGTLDGCAANVTDAMLAASGHIFGALGDFEQCYHLQNAKYCTLKEGPPLRSLTIGICVPETCAPHEMSGVLEDYFGVQLHHLTSIHCQTMPQSRIPWSSGMWLVVLIYLALLVCCSLATLTAMIVGQRDDTAATPLLLPDFSSPPALCKPLRHSVGIDALWQSFDVRQNWHRLTSPFTGDTHCFNVLRSLAMLWVILAHTVYFAMDVHSIKDKEYVLAKVLPSFFFVLVPTADLAVDCFFWLSGYLATTHLLAFLQPVTMDDRLVENPHGVLLKGMLSWLVLVADRYLRLTPLYALLLFTYWKWVPHLGSGPLWPHVQELIGQCNGHWLYNLLYINNFFPPEINRSCMSWTWYLANDLQFSLLAPIFASLYCRCRPLGLLITAGILITSLYLNEVYYFGDPFKERPYCRISPYIYGVWAAFFMQWLQESEVENNSLYSKVRSFLQQPFLRRTIYAAGTLLAGSATVLLWYGFASWLQGRYLPLPVQKFSAFYQRAVWGPGLTLLLLPSLLGCDSALQPYLQLRGWVVLARLTYAAYLVHPICMMMYFGNGYNAPTFTRFHFVVWCFLFTTLSYSIAAILYLLCEGPLISLQKKVLRYQR